MAPIDQNCPSGSPLPALPVEANRMDRAPEGPTRRERGRGVTFRPIPTAGTMDDGGDGTLPRR
ncbi:hypothetical protein [Acetobacter indonesiensis]|uniref:hypothetical protein n=1 Tax=Acetobacter indonesiensis TaxID=104101 RepID=UPI0011BE2698|nr:hypothetical protein [Acetobacter indonesiensis]